MNVMAEVLHSATLKVQRSQFAKKCSRHIRKKISERDLSLNNLCDHCQRDLEYILLTFLLVDQRKLFLSYVGN